MPPQERISDLISSGISRAGNLGPSRSRGCGPVAGHGLLDAGIPISIYAPQERRLARWLDGGASSPARRAIRGSPDARASCACHQTNFSLRAATNNIRSSSNPCRHR